LSPGTPQERNLGEQPITGLLAAHGLKAHDLVAASTEQITHKMVARACKGRWLTPNTRAKILRALNAVSGKAYTPGELFNY
jgi:hypothetical protein